MIHQSKVVYAPTRTGAKDPYGVDVFLAGSIEMGRASDWQTVLSYVLSREEGVGRIFNPRRPDWNSSWDQSPSNPHFRMQVDWELDYIEKADVAFFNFVPGTMSPITLAEFGFMMGRNEYPIVCCPKDFWRSGNVHIMAARNNVQCYYDYEEAVEALIGAIRAIHHINCA